MLMKTFQIFLNDALKQFELRLVMPLASSDVSNP